ncbi:MAG: LPS assembly lipoprotein LptE [Pseudomonadota bacterium]
MSRLTTSLAALLLAGCGFQLQGAYSLPDAVLTGTHISTTDTYSPFYRELGAAMSDAGVEVLPVAGDAPAVLTILFEETGQRVLSVSARNVPTEYEVYYTVEYSLVAGEQTLVTPRLLSLTRDYRWDENLVLGKAAEEEELRQAIIADLVRILIKQIDSI